MGVVFFCAFGVWIYFVKQEYQKTIPKSETLAGHFESMPEPEQYWIFEKNGKEYLGVIGPQQARISFPSCSPVYIFDKNEKLIAWTSDHGDDTHFSERWGMVFKGQKVDRATTETWQQK